MKQFKYIGRTNEHTESDWPVVHRNVVKARAAWHRLGKLMQCEEMDNWVSSLFYRAVIHVVLLFGL